MFTQISWKDSSSASRPTSTVRLCEPGGGRVEAVFVLGSTRERKANKLNPPGHRDLTPICPCRGGAPGPATPGPDSSARFSERSSCPQRSTNQHPAALDKPTSVRFVSYSPRDNLLGSAVPVAMTTATLALLLVTQNSLIAEHLSENKTQSGRK